MSALPPKADMCSALACVRFVPIADIARLSPQFNRLPIRRDLCRLYPGQCLACVSATACAPKVTVVPVPVITTPEFPDFVASTFARRWPAVNRRIDRIAAGSFSRPVISRTLSGNSIWRSGWRRGSILLRRVWATSSSHAMTPARLFGHFNRTLDTQHGDLSALVGQGQALLALDRERDALASFEAALAVDPSVGDLAAE